MGCDIHLIIQRQELDGEWREIVWQSKPWRDDAQPIDGIPVAPDCFDSRNYDKFAILADVRNGIGFAGIKTGEGWPSIAPDRGFPEGFHDESVAPRPESPEYGQHSRIVKPRTKNQRAAIAKTRKFAFGSPTPAPGSTTSWWIGASREELAQRAREEQARMNASKFGRLPRGYAMGE